MADEGITRVIRVQIDASQAYAQTQKFEKNIDGMAKSLTKLQKGFDLVTQSWAAMKGLTSAWEGIKGIVTTADEVKQLAASLQVLLPQAKDSAQAIEIMANVANNVGIKLDDATKTAQRFAVALGPAGASVKTIAALTENILMLGRIGGASMADVTEGARQLGQAFASGKLQGDELRSIMERIPLVGQQIAQTMNKATGELYKLGAEGKITTDILFKALLADSEKIRKQFEQLPVTFEQSVNRMSTAWTLFAVEFDKTSGLGKTLTILFSYIGELMNYITGQLKEGNDELNGWQIIVRGVGDAFKGLVIVVSAVVTGITQAFTATTALFNAFKKAATGDFAGAWGEITKGSKEALAQGDKWKTFANDIALGTNSFKKTAKETKVEIDNYNKVLGNLHNTMDKTGKKTKEATSELEKFKKQIKELLDAPNINPEKVLILKKAMDSVNLSTEDGILLYKELQDMLDKIRPPSAVTKAFREVDKAIDDLNDQRDTLFALQEKLMELQEAGAEGTDTWIAYKKAYDELNQKLDDNGVVKAIADIQELIKKGKDLQLQFDAINQAVEDGTIPEAWAENWKKAQLGVSDSTKQLKEDTKTLGAQLADLSKKFTEDFADKLVDNIGKVDTAWGDFVEDFLKSIAKILVNAAFQNFIKTMANLYSGGGGMFGSFLTALTKSAKGNAWNAAGAQFMATGGILNGPTFFNNAGRLAVAGEAGPEAVVPLQRTASGDLGVGASPVNITINNNAAQTTEVTQTSSDNSDGSKQITIFIEQKVKSMFSSGSMDRTMSSSYGLSRQPR